ncbi:ATPase [Aureococcus anophagefferens]|nr:ATPase [Aureococcus anophagefferens]
MAPDWWLVLTALVCVVGSGGAALALPSYQGEIIDAVYARQRAKFQNRLLLYLVFSVGTAVSQALRALCFQVTGRRLACALRNRLYRAILSQDVAFFDATASGTLTSRLTQDVNQMTQPLTTLVGTLTSAMISLVGGVAMAFYTSWRLSMLAFTTVGPIMHVTQAYAQWSREQNRKILAHLGEANAAATEALANVRTVKAMATDELEQRRYEGHTCAARDRGVVDASLSATTQLVNNVLDYGAGWLILFYGGAQAMKRGGDMSAGKLVTYQLYFNKIQSSYNQLISLLSSFTRASGAAQRVLGLLQSMPEKGRGGDDSGEVAGRVRCWRLLRVRPNPERAGGFDLDVAAGSTLALVGKSGSGKTTALHLLLRFYDPARGDVLLDGRPLRSLDVAFLRRHFAIVAQETQLFNTTIYGNIAYGVDGADPAAVAERPLDEFIRDFPRATTRTRAEGHLRRFVSRQLQVSANTIDETKVDAAAAAHALDIDELIRQAQEAQDALVAAPGRS